MRPLYLIPTLFLLAWIALAGCSSAPGEREFRAGLRELKRGNDVRAKAQFERAIERRPGDPANAVAYNFLGLANMRLNQNVEAIRSFEESRRIDPTYWDPVYNLGVVYADAGNMAEAVRVLSEAAMLDPADTRSLEYLADALIRRQSWPEARRALYAALNRDPDSPRIHTSIGLLEYYADSPERALTSFMKALENNAGYAPALFNLATMYETRLKQPEQAIAYYERFVKAAKGDARVATAKASIARLKAAAAPQVTTPPASATASASGAESPATAKPAAAASAEDVLRQAATLGERGKTSLALDLCLQVASNAARRGQLDLQERALRTAVRACFDQPQAHVELGNFLVAQKQADAALRSFKQALVLDSDNVGAQLGMAEAAIATGEYDAALIGLKQAVRADPRNADALFALARLYDRQLDLPSNAAKSYREFARAFPNDPRAVAAQQRAREISPVPEAPEANAGEPVEPPPSARPAQTQPTVATSPAMPPPARVESDVSGEPARRTLDYRKPGVRNTQAAIQAFRRGSEFQARKEWDRAIFYYLRSLENDDLLANTFYNLGTAYTVKGDFDLAKDSYLRALALQPTMLNARYNLALIYREQRDNPSAIKVLNDVIQADPRHAQAHYVLGYLYASSPQTYAQAREHYGRFLQLAPNDPSARSVKQWLDATAQR